MQEQSRPLTADAVVSLREVTAETVNQILKLDVSDEQKSHVATNAKSIAQAYFEPAAWFRAIYADDTPVGFIMFYIKPDEDEYFLWRFMVDERWQGLGFGSRGMTLALDYIRRTYDPETVAGSYSPGEHSAAGFYRKYGFRETGELNEGELVIKYKLR